MYIMKACGACGSEKVSKSPAILAPFIADRVFDWAPVEITAEWGLKSTKVGVAHCRLNSVGCHDCASIFSDLRFCAEEVEKLYRDYRGHEYTSSRTAYEPEYKAKAKTLHSRYPYLLDAESWIKGYLTPQSILDWGGGNGLNSMFKYAGNELYVHDVSGVAIGRGIKSFFEHDCDVNFDLVTCNQVLEHVSEPLNVLTEIKRLMSDDTWLYFDLPYEKIMHDSIPIIERLKRKRHWHEHINFFTEKGVRQLVNRADLNVIDLRIVSATDTPGEDLIFQTLVRKR